MEELINELKNLIGILKTITKENQGTHFNSSKSGKSPLEKTKSRLNKKTRINEPIPLSNRFSPMDIDSDKTDTIKLQKETS